MADRMFTSFFGVTLVVLEVCDCKRDALRKDSGLLILWGNELGSVTGNTKCSRSVKSDQ